MKMSVHFETENERQAAYLVAQLAKAFGPATLREEPQTVTAAAGDPSYAEVVEAETRANAAPVAEAPKPRSRQRKPLAAVAPANETPPASVLEPPPIETASAAAPPVPDIVKAEADKSAAVVAELRADGTVPPRPQALPGAITIELDEEVVTYEPPFTVETARDAVKKILEIKSLGIPAAREVLTKFGVGKAAEVPAEKYPEFLAEVKRVIEAARDVTQ